MTYSNYLKQPVRSPSSYTCLPCCWYPSFSSGAACYPAPLIIRVTLGGSFTAIGTFAFDIGDGLNGITLNDPPGTSRVSCTTSNPYLTLQTNAHPYAQFTYDLWGAYKAGVWSSSTAIAFYGRWARNGGTLSMYPETGSSGDCFYYAEIGSDNNIKKNCVGLNYQTTITVNENGLISIA